MTATRSIRSFVRRRGRLTAAQRRALDTLWTRFGAEPGPGLLDLDALFGRHAPRTLEIGFGDGEALAAAALAHPEMDFLGIEVHRPGIGHLLLRAEALGLTNLRVLCADAVEVFEHHLADGGLACIRIFFPDPWPKSRHHKRRLLQPPFAAQMAAKLEPGGRLHLATDWEDYAEHMLAVLEATAGLVNVAGPGRFVPSGTRPVTRFERRGERLGHGVRDLIFERRRTDDERPRGRACPENIRLSR